MNPGPPLSQNSYVLSLLQQHPVHCQRPARILSELFHQIRHGQLGSFLTGHIQHDPSIIHHDRAVANFQG